MVYAEEKPESSLAIETIRARLERGRRDPDSMRIFNNFVRFHRANPEVWGMFERDTLRLIQAGAKRFSARDMFGRIRWSRIVTNGDAFKINNNYAAYYSRLWALMHPEYGDFYGKRQIAGQEEI